MCDKEVARADELVRLCADQAAKKIAEQESEAAKELKNVKLNVDLIAETKALLEKFKIESENREA